MTYNELANRCREITMHVMMLAQVQNEPKHRKELEERIERDWSAIANSHIPSSEDKQS